MYEKESERKCGMKMKTTKQYQQHSYSICAIVDNILTVNSGIKVVSLISLGRKKKYMVSQVEKMKMKMKLIIAIIIMTMMTIMMRKISYFKIELQIKVLDIFFKF